jgi:predicted negative regulator of RcsB-dependent stress response
MSEPSTHPVPIGEIVQGPSAFEQFLENNQKLIAVGAVAVALAIGGFTVYRTMQADHAAEAGAALVAAKDMAELEKVKMNFSDTPSAVTAAMGIADKMWTNNQQDEAIATLREIIEKFPQHPATVIAQNALGHRLMAQGKTGDAAAAFQAVVDRQQDRYLSPAALISLGDLAKKEGKLDQAAELYKKVSAEFPESSFASVAADRVKFLNFSAPVEVEPAPVVTEPPPSIVKPDDQPTGAGLGTGGTGNPLLDSLNQAPVEKEEEAPEPQPAPPTPEP